MKNSFWKNFRKPLLKKIPRSKVKIYVLYGLLIIWLAIIFIILTR